MSTSASTAALWVVRRRGATGDVSRRSMRWKLLGFAHPAPADHGQVPSGATEESVDQAHVREEADAPAGQVHLMERGAALDVGGEVDPLRVGPPGHLADRVVEPFGQDPAFSPVRRSKTAIRKRSASQPATLCVR